MQLASIFTDHMVFQANKPIYVFGSGAGDVSVSFLGQTIVRSFSDDSWCMALPAQPYGGAYEISITLNDVTITLHDIYIGEVLLCAGQSNMQMKMKDEITPQEEYISDDLLRLFYVDRPEENPITESMGWLPCKKEMVENWPAIPYLTGLRLRKKGIAVGLISCNQGASVIQSWMRKEYLSNPDFNIPLEEKFIDHTHDIYSRWNPDSFLYTSMLTKLLPYSVSTVLWYQGESNASPAEGKIYLRLLTCLIANWREDFQDATLPFIVIQIADTSDRLGEGWFGVQNAQLEIEKVVPNVHSVRCADICETDNIHPPTKWKLCDRIAALL